MRLPTAARFALEVRVEAEAESHDPDFPSCCDSRSGDSGIGLPAEQRELVVERSRRRTTHHACDMAARGLGLTISARLVAMMGGRILAGKRSRPWDPVHFAIRCGVERRSPHREEQVSLPVFRGLWETTIHNGGFRGDAPALGMQPRW